MAEEKCCPMVLTSGRTEPVLCARDKCAWWDEKQLRCRVAGGTAELERMVTMVGAFIEDDLEPLGRALNNVGMGLIEVTKKLERLG